jgi:predicted transglutaminase-like cysteine proteinase
MYSIGFLILTFPYSVNALEFENQVSDESSIIMADVLYEVLYETPEFKDPLKQKVIEKFGIVDFNKSDNLDIIKHLKMMNTKIQSDFKYKPDELSNSKIDDWRSEVDNLINNGKFEGDCDDLALTSLQIAEMTGIPNSRLYKIISKSGRTYNGDTANHMVAGYKDKNGDIWIFGDTFIEFTYKYQPTSNLHKIHKYKRKD